MRKNQKFTSILLGLLVILLYYLFLRSCVPENQFTGSQEVWENNDKGDSLFALLVADNRTYGVECAECDIREMNDLLKGKNFKVANILTILVKNILDIGGNPKAKFVDELIKLSKLKYSKILIYFSGHGDQVPDQIGGDEKDDRNDEVLLIGASKLIDDELDAIFRTFDKSSIIYFITDCCHSGTNFQLIGREFKIINDFTFENEFKNPNLLHFGAVSDERKARCNKTKQNCLSQFTRKFISIVYSDNNLKSVCNALIGNSFIVNSYYSSLDSFPFINGPLF